MSDPGALARPPRERTASIDDADLATRARMDVETESWAAFRPHAATPQRGIGSCTSIMIT
jgi:hypothetical protein